MKRRTVDSRYCEHFDNVNSVKNLYNVTKEKVGSLFAPYVCSCAYKFFVNFEMAKYKKSV